MIAMVALEVVSLSVSSEYVVLNLEVLAIWSHKVGRLAGFNCHVRIPGFS